MKYSYMGKDVLFIYGERRYLLSPDTSWESNSYVLGKGLPEIFCRDFCHLLIWLIVLYMVSLQNWYFSISILYCLWSFIQGFSLWKEGHLLYWSDFIFCLCIVLLSFYVRDLLFLMSFSFYLVPPTQLLPTFSHTSVAKNKIHFRKNNVLQFLLQSMCI